MVERVRGEGHTLAVGRPPRRVWVEAFGTTDIGRVRRHNEDRFLVADLTSGSVVRHPALLEHDLGTRGFLFIVADGMGGAAAGELASQIATDTIYRQLVESCVRDKRVTPHGFVCRLKEAAEAANEEIYAYAAPRPELRGMGTTATAVGLLADHIYLAQVGDSRAYLVRAGQAHQLTKDQSLVQQLIDAGELTEEEAARSERRNVLLQALGPAERVHVDLTSQQLRRGDVLVLCSDGLSIAVSACEIAEIVAADDGITAACERLIGLANERGGRDNITVVVVKFQGEGLPPAAQERIGYAACPLPMLDSTVAAAPGTDGRDRESRKGRWWLPW